MTLPPLNTPIQHTGGATCPVHPDTWVSVEYRKVHPRHPNEITGKAGSRNWPDVITFTIIARAPADRIAELEAALALAIDVAESWIHDQLDGTSGLETALAELEPARITLKGTSHVL